MGQFKKTVKILNDSINKLIDMRDNWFPVGSGYSDELYDYVYDNLNNMIEEIEDTQADYKWTDSIGQPI